MLDLDRAVLLRERPGAGELVALGATGWPSGMLGLTVAADDPATLVGHTARTGAATVVIDSRTEERFSVDRWLPRDRPGSGLAVPLFEGGRTGAVIVAVCDQPGRDFEADELDFVEQVVQVLSQALERDVVEAQLRERVKELGALYGVTRELQEQPDPLELLESTARRLQTSMQYPELTEVRVCLDDQTVATDDEWPVAGATLRAEIRADGALRGSIEVGYRHERAFLDEERHMLDTVGEIIGGWLERADSQAELRAHQNRLEALVEAAPGVLAIVDRDTRVQLANAATAEILGLSRGELESLRFDQLDHVGFGVTTTDGAPIDLADRPLQRVLGGQGPVAGVEVGLQRPDGQRRIMEMHLAPLHDEGDEQPTGAVLLGVDVTQAHRQREQLRESQEQLQSLFDHTLEGIVLLDDQGRYVDANPAACRLLGYERDELLSRSMADVAPGGGTAALWGTWQRFLARGHLSDEAELGRSDGTAVTVEFEAVAHIRPGVHLSIMHDITDRKRAEQALRASEERFRQLAEHMTEGLFRYRFGPEPGYDYVNPALTELVGLAADEIVAAPERLHERLHPEDRERLNRALAATAEVLSPTSLRLRARDGAWRWVELRGVLIREEHGKLRALQGVVIDVTRRQEEQQALERALDNERHATQRLRAVNEMKNTFLQAVSHELRTPLSSLLGFAHTLQHHEAELSGSRRAELFERMTANAHRLRRLLDDLLDVDRLTRGELTSEGQLLDLADVAQSAVEQAEIGRDVILDLQPTSSVADQGHVMRMVTNLVVNADRHTPTGTRVWVRTHPTDEGALLVVEDEGPGVPDHLKAAVFQPFQQGTEAAADPNPGTGIGLNLVAQFAELHGGQAWVEDRSGGGARFCVRLPGGDTRGADTPEGNAQPPDGG